MRRPSRSDKAGVTVPPLPKRVKKASSEASTLAVSSDDDGEYDKHIGFLQRSFQSNKWSHGSMLVLMEETAEHRRRWIRDESPSVQLVLEKFPFLADPRVVSVYTCA